MTNKNNIFKRTEMLIGKENIERLSGTSVAVFGIGGVGSYAAESLVRNGIGSIHLIDYDIIEASNINRQVHSSLNTLGLKKVDVMKERLLSINPDLKIEIYDLKYSKDNKSEFPFEEFDYVLDCIDTISAKIDLVMYCSQQEIPVISAMGAGSKLDPTQIQIGDIYSTKYCPLARVMRRELKKRGLKRLKVAWSLEDSVNICLEKEGFRKSTPSSAGFVPPVMGFSMAAEAFKDIIDYGGVI